MMSGSQIPRPSSRKLNVQDGSGPTSSDARGAVYQVQTHLSSSFSIAERQTRVGARTAQPLVHGRRRYIDRNAYYKAVSVKGVGDLMLCAAVAYTANPNGWHTRGAERGGRMPHVNPHDLVTAIFIKLMKNPFLKKQFVETLLLLFDQPDVASSPVLQDLPGKPNVRNPRKSLAPAVVESS
ncbi:hypothetical protein EVAR_34672_1 [Eumeta japonica]|uniref:Uncharacterized protein n=1 Tax=Eumeta variegata TaxID=151549 RepID=A0A4C1VIU4_EUMVA|nr:hypothetical protein EVAR_34672_1 [Eumeta japonica]